MARVKYTWWGRIFQFYFFETVLLCGSEKCKTIKRHKVEIWKSSLRSVPIHPVSPTHPKVAHHLCYFTSCFECFPQTKVDLSPFSSGRWTHSTMWSRLFMCLCVAGSGLSCSRRVLVPWPGTDTGPLRWEHTVLATGAPGTSPCHVG